ncbi:MAG: Nramp family divalent metal transporter [bacterium]|nr:Nramp family divalent metal transporter [bacterium]
MNKIDVPPVGGVFAEPWSLKKVTGLFAVFGPAAIVASVAIGAGETIVVVRAGAWAGYGLLWLVLLSSVVKGVFVTYMIGRYTAVSGEYLGHRLVRLPGPRGWLLIGIMAVEMIGAPLAWVPISKSCGNLFHYLFRGLLSDSISESTWVNLLTTGFVCLALLLALRLSYERLERQQIIICGILLVGTVIGTAIVKPDLWATLVGSVNFGHLPEFPPWAPEDAVKNPMLMMGTTFGYVGGSVMGYISYANFVGLHGWGVTGHKDIEAIRSHAASEDKVDYLPETPEEVAGVRKLLAPLRWDAGMGALVLFVVTAAFMLSGAVVLYPLQSRFDGWNLLTNQAYVWQNIHPALVWVYYVCIVAALWGTLQALPEIYTRVSQEFFEAIWPDRTWDYGCMQRIICLYIFVTVVTIIWLDIPFDILTHVAGFLLANLAIAVIVIAAIYLNFKLPAAYRTRPLMLVGTLVSAVILVIFAGISGWGLIGKIF